MKPHWSINNYPMTQLIQFKMSKIPMFCTKGALNSACDSVKAIDCPPGYTKIILTVLLRC